MNRQKNKLATLPELDLSVVACIMDLETAIRKLKNNKGAGEDGIPMDVFKLLPSLMATVILPLAMETTGLALEPIQHKGGMLFEL